MNARELLNFFRSHSIELTIVDDKIKLKAPRGFMTDELLDSLKKNKNEIIALLETNNDNGQLIPRHPKDASIPLSYAQQRLWFLDQFEPGSAYYNIPGAIRLIGALNEAALQQTVNEIVRRHEAVRTHFAMVEDVPVQVIAEQLDVPLKVIDLADISATEREAHAQELIQKEAQTPFDLSTGPLIRVNLLRLDTRDHILLFTLHHIVSDGWSMGILVNEVAALYPAFVQGGPSPLPDLPIQYADFAHWQRQWLSGEVLQEQLTYWTRQLDGSPTLLTLPTDHPRPLVESHQGATHTFEISEQITAGLHKLSNQTRTTLFMSLVAAFNVLLARYSGQEDICIGSPIANRNRAEIESLIGFFVNTLVLRSHVDSTASFETFLEQVRTTTLDAYAHQDVPFEQLVEVLKPERHTSHSPLFQVMLVLQNMPVDSLKLPNIIMKLVTGESKTAKFDLTLALMEAEGKLRASLEYNTDLFEPATIQRMAGHFTHLLEAIVAHPNAHIQDLPMLSAEERQQILVAWNDTQAEYPPDKCIHELFEEQVERTPDAVAVVVEDQQLTYSELNARANQLAHYLRSQGVRPDVLVGICMERSLEMIVALLGILKAGGAYVPLDPNHPKERLEFMLEDSQAVVLLLQARLQDRFPQHSAQMIFLDAGWQESIAVQPTTVPHSFANSSNLAYVLFTSGTTGRPKGVAIQHRNAVALFQWIKETYSPRELSGVLASTSIGFDLSVYEIFGTLTLGGCVILAENVLQLPTLAAKERIRLVNTVPSAMTELLRQDGLPPSVETVNLAGEPLTTHLVNELYRTGTIRRVIDAYGPTENTTYSTFVVRQTGMAPTIGRPLPHWTTYILDKYLNPMPIGVVGELFIGGMGVARGYLNRSNLTAEKFLPNPFSREPGARMYRTGDLARWLPNGNLEFFGRIDHQVKIRGFRIELGEIETVLSRHPAVQSCIVLAREDQSGDKRLVAYLVAQEGHNLPEVSELRSRLAQSLPEYMVPSFFIFLAELPLTPNGKVDRRALPAPDMARKDVGYAAPRTPTEEILAQIWAEVLHVERVGVHDNFFELGGHSLLATQVVSRIRQTLDAEVSLRMLFQTPTVAGLAEQIQTLHGTKMLPLLPVARTEPLPLSFAQERLWFLDQLEPGLSVYNIPAALRLKGTLDLAAVRASLQEILRRHAVLRTHFVVVEEQPVQVIDPGFEFTLPVIDLRDLAEAEREREVVRLVAEEARQTFDLSTGPLFRARLLRLEDAEYVLVLNMHHIVSDGWSLGILFQELVTLYDAFSHGQTSPLSELPIQYADFAVWQREWLQGEVLAEQLTYWKEQLGGELPVLELPTDRSRPAIASYAGSSQSFLVPEKLSQALKALSQEQDVTLFMLLLAAFQVLLMHYSGQTDIVIGSPIANRNRTEIEDLIGLFVNTLALRTDLSGDPSFVELLRRVREACLGAYAHQDVPFEKLVQELHLERDMSRNPLFQVMFILQNAPMGAWELTDLMMSGIEMEHRTAKFDLTLSMVEIHQGLMGRLEYSTDLFEAAAMERMVRHFQILLERIVLDPQQLLHELQLINDTELHQPLAPEYTLPANFTSFTLTPSGKIDRRASSAPNIARSGISYVAPRTPTEESLAQIWAEVLHLGKVGIHDNFFELGGHSLLATRVVSRIRQTLDAEVPLRMLFQTPTVAGLAEQIQTLHGIKSLPLLPVARTEPLPLSFAQQRLWFLDQFEPGSAYYNIPGAIRLTGELNEVALQQTMNEIVRRHEVLRTSFAMMDGTPVQAIAEQLDVQLNIIDLQGTIEKDREMRTQELAQAEAQTPFDLSAGPLIRVNLLRLTETDHILLFTLHHIVSDGWSMGILANEVAALYPAFVQGEPSPLPELPIQYADFAHWQRQWLSGDVLRQQLKYWTVQLKDSPTLLTLPTDHPRPAVQSHHGATHAFEISETITTGLHKLNTQTRTTLFMSLVAAFNVLLSRYSGQNDICLGSPIANRNRAEVEDLIGFFVNTLVLRTRIDSTASFETLLEQVRSTTLDAYAHQDVPFEQLVDVLKVERHTSHAPLFQVMLVLQNAPLGSLELPGLTLQPVTTESTAAKFDLTLTLTETDDKLAAVFVYNTDLFEPATIQRMAGHFTHLLEAIVAQPSARIQDLPMLRAEERQQMLVEWNDTQVDYPRDKCIHELFEGQVERTPEAVAVVFEDQQLTYHELNARANQLAHYLRSQGVGPDVLMGICVERSIEMIVAILGILKAGGAYVPLDPDYPQERLVYMLEDARPAVLLTQQSMQGILPMEGFCLDSQWDTLAGYPTSNLDHTVLPDNLVYVIYTSGSTGRSKGIGISHRSTINLATALVARIYCQMGKLSGKRIGLNASISFDSSVKQLLMLLYGVTLYVLPNRIRADMDVLAATINDWDLDGMDCTPSQLSLLLPAGRSRKLPKSFLIGGEAIDQTLWNALREQPELRFYNVYGPTEATVDTIICDIHASGNIPVLGKPIANAQVYILDPALRPVPMGVAGELHIAGAGLARGYLNRPDLTAEKFIPNPFSREPGARMYRTGDLARWLPDGNLEFLGRVDHQIKLRGFRIELGEIEAALTALPEVHEVVVLARENIPGDKHLVAYLVMQEGHNLPEVSELRSRLAQSLPEYMLPSFFVFLAKLPLTPNGKVDRKALPAPDMTRREVGYVAPRTPTEESLVQIWAEVLHVERVGVHDNFFELGGHSLLATRVVSRIRQTLDAEVPLRMLFQTPTIAGLAEQIQTLHGIKALPLLPVARTEPLPLSFAQQRLWFLDQFAPGSAYYSIPGAIRLTGELNEVALQQTMNEIVRRHEVLRTSFAMMDGTPVQVIATQFDVPLSVIDLQGLIEEDRETYAQELAQEEAQTPFDLSTGPLIRVSLLRLDTQDHILLFTLHHIVSDGWSMGILANEVAALYPAFVQGGPSPLPELPIQYADFAHWQRQWLSGEVLHKQLEYWTGQLKDSPTVLTLPTDHPRPVVQSHHGATLAFEISTQITAGLYALNQRSQTTLFMPLVAAFNILLARYSGQDDICIGSPIANRNRAEVEDLIGFFVNTLVLRTRIDSTASFETFLEQVRTTTLDAYAHQDVPFEQLVEVLKVERHTSHAPLFQVMLVLQNAPLGSLELPGLTLQPVATESTAAKFDLTLALTEADGKLQASLEYNTDLFESATIQRMAGHFTHLLEAIVAQPNKPVQDLSMLDTSEQHQLLVAWNDTQTEYPQDKCIHELFEEQVERTPDAVALVFEDQQLTYRDLNARANQLARYLRSQGVGPDVLVGICVERSLEMIVGLLAILKAGGAYLPLDPSYPKERLAYMLEDARPAAVLTQTHLQSTLPANSFCLDSQWDALDSYASGNPENITLPDNVAYVIYTSGSTGKPKGVMLKHNGLSNLVHAQVDAFSIQGTQRILQFASFNFDASTSEIFMALSCGAMLCLASRADLTPGEQLEKTLQQLAINVVTLPPVALNLLSPAALPRLETIIVAGEACPGSLATQWSGTYNFFNAYGPTETTVCASIQRCHVGQAGIPPIGYPISNVQVYVLDATRHPVPVGVAGELYVSGDGVARGYLNRPDLTAEKFLPNPFSREPGARMYRTGDLVRWLPDGNLEFLGRIDHQVKLRGFRIELGEIEAALTALPEVREVVVLAREDILGDKRLVAYLVMQPEHNLPEVSDLRDQLSHSLPEYMLPAHFIQLAQLPLTPNGKVDRKALPAPDMTRREVGYIAPRTPTEDSLAQIWAEVLHLDKVGIHDNFFELGGHSLLAVRLMARIQQTFQYQIPLSSLFQSPTLEQFAVLVTERAASPWSPIVPIQPHGSRTPLFCIHEATGFASFYTDLAQHLGPDQPVYGLQARGLDQQLALHTSIQEMAACYLDAIQQVQPRGPYLLAGHSMGGMIAYEISQQLRQRGEETAFLGLLDTHIHIPSDVPEPADEKILVEYLRQADRPIEHLDQMFSETGENIVPKAFAIAQQAGLVPADLCLADFQRYFEVYKTNIHAASTYQPQPYSETATLFVCQEHPAKDATRKQANIDRWSSLVHNLELYKVPGNHRSMVLPPHVDYLAAEISNCLRRVLPET